MIKERKAERTLKIKSKGRQKRQRIKEERKTKSKGRRLEEVKESNRQRVG